MTKEEAITRIKDHKITHKMHEPRAIYISEALDMAIKALEQDTVPFDFELYEAGLMDMPKGMIEMLDKIKAEIKDWYWQADKQALAKDPCVVDAMIDLFIRTIDKYKAEKE